MALISLANSNHHRLLHQSLLLYMATGSSVLSQVTLLSVFLDFDRSVDLNDQDADTKSPTTVIHHRSPILRNWKTFRFLFAVYRKLSVKFFWILQERGWKFGTLGMSTEVQFEKLQSNRNRPGNGCFWDRPGQNL